MYSPSHLGEAPLADAVDPVSWALQVSVDWDGLGVKDGFKIFCRMWMDVMWSPFYALFIAWACTLQKLEHDLAALTCYGDLWDIWFSFIFCLHSRFLLHPFVCPTHARLRPPWKMLQMMSRQRLGLGNCMLQWVWILGFWFHTALSIVKLPETCTSWDFWIFLVVLDLGILVWN